MSQGHKFGTFKGVFIPSILTILGVVMYLRIGWVLGQVGLVQTLVIITLATSITFLTALSLAALSTNMAIGRGGAYFLISRSLGIETGGAIGLPLYLAQTVGIAFYIAGFVESLQTLVPFIPPIWLGLGTLMLLTILVFISANLALRLQFVILTLILLSLVSFFMGAAVVSVPEQAEAVTTWPFWAVFAVFFPAVTGIEAGLSLSGELKRPELSLPVGTLGAVVLSYLVYLAIPVFLDRIGLGQERLVQHSMIMMEVAKWKPLVLLGLWGASLSSAVGALLGAPRTLQALAMDRVIPSFLGKRFGKDMEPRYAIVVTFCLAGAGVLAGGINVIAPVLSMFFLTSYAFLNLSAFFEIVMKNPSWRPKFKVHWVFPLLGFLGCLATMMMINAGATIAAVFVVGLIFFLLQRRRLNVYWGDLRYGIYMLLIRFLLMNLARVKMDEKSWRPNILVLGGLPSNRWNMISLADAISRGSGFLSVVSVFPEETMNQERMDSVSNLIKGYLDKRSVPAWVKVITAHDIFEAAEVMVKAYGFGPLKPNTIFLGDIGCPEDILKYVEIVMLIVRSKKNLVIVIESEQDEEESNVPSHEESIDVWWRQNSENAGFMLTLAYMLQTSPEWKKTSLTIKSLEDTVEERLETEAHYKAYFEQAKLEAGIEIMQCHKDQSFQTISASSKAASCVFLGLRKPEEGESKESYARYIESCFEYGRNFKTTILVLASESVDFKDIFSFEVLKSG